MNFSTILGLRAIPEHYPEGKIHRERFIGLFPPLKMEKSGRKYSRIQGINPPGFHDRLIVVRGDIRPSKIARKNASPKTRDADARQSNSSPEFKPRSNRQIACIKKTDTQRHAKKIGAKQDHGSGADAHNQTASGQCRRTNQDEPRFNLPQRERLRIQKRKRPRRSEAVGNQTKGRTVIRTSNAHQTECANEIARCHRCRDREQRWSGGSVRPHCRRLHQ